MKPTKKRLVRRVKLDIVAIRRLSEALAKTIYTELMKASELKVRRRV